MIISNPEIFFELNFEQQLLSSLVKVVHNPNTVISEFVMDKVFDFFTVVCKEIKTSQIWTHDFEALFSACQDYLTAVLPADKLMTCESTVLISAASKFLLGLAKMSQKSDNTESTNSFICQKLDFVYFTETIDNLIGSQSLAPE